MPHQAVSCVPCKGGTRLSRRSLTPPGSLLLGYGGGSEESQLHFLYKLSPMRDDSAMQFPLGPTHPLPAPCPAPRPPSPRPPWQRLGLAWFLGPRFPWHTSQGTGTEAGARTIRPLAMGEGVPRASAPPAPTWELDSAHTPLCCRISCRSHSRHGDVIYGFINQPRQQLAARGQQGRLRDRGRRPPAGQCAAPASPQDPCPCSGSRGDCPWALPAQCLHPNPIFLLRSPMPELGTPWGRCRSAEEGASPPESEKPGGWGGVLGGRGPGYWGVRGGGKQQAVPDHSQPPFQEPCSGASGHATGGRWFF